MTNPSEAADQPDDFEQPQKEFSEPIRLDQFLKLEGMVGTGGEAKLRIQSGEVLVNGEPETRRRKKLQPGDVVECAGEKAVVPETAS